MKVSYILHQFFRLIHNLYQYNIKNDTGEQGLGYFCSNPRNKEADIDFINYDYNNIIVIIKNINKKNINICILIFDLHVCMLGLKFSI